MGAKTTSRCTSPAGGTPPHLQCLALALLLGYGSPQRVSLPPLCTSTYSIRLLLPTTYTHKPDKHSFPLLFLRLSPDGLEKKVATRLGGSSPPCINLKLAPSYSSHPHALPPKMSGSGGLCRTNEAHLVGL